jgi:hypothetical protein
MADSQAASQQQHEPDMPPIAAALEAAQARQAAHVVQMAAPPTPLVAEKVKQLAAQEIDK